MSYCRLGVDGSGVYAYADINGYYKGWYAGNTFKVATLQDLKELLLKAQKEGYHVPDYAFSLIEEELIEQIRKDIKVDERLNSEKP